MRCCSRATFAAASLAVFALSTAGGAQAQDSGWSGFSVGVGVGAGHISHDAAATSTVHDQFDLNIPRKGRRKGSLFSLDIDGFAQTTTPLGEDEWAGFGTAQLAYDQQFGNLVVGILADFDFYPDGAGGSASESFDGDLTISGNRRRRSFGPFTFPITGYASVASDVEIENVWSIGGRVGILVTPTTLLYGLGGYTEMSLDGQATLSYLNVVEGPQTLSVKMPDELSGFFVGAGGEMKVANNLALRLEYRYADYSGEGEVASESYSRRFRRIGARYQNDATVSTDVEAEIHSVRAALVFKLGTP